MRLCWGPTALVECSLVQSGAGYLIDSHQADLGRRHGCHVESREPAGRQKKKLSPRHRFARITTKYIRVRYNNNNYMPIYDVPYIYHSVGPSPPPVIIAIKLPVYKLKTHAKPQRV